MEAAFAAARAESAAEQYLLPRLARVLQVRHLPHQAPAVRPPFRRTRTRAVLPEERHAHGIEVERKPERVPELGEHPADIEGGSDQLRGGGQPFDAVPKPALSVQSRDRVDDGCDETTDTAHRVIAIRSCRSGGAEFAADRRRERSRPVLGVLRRAWREEPTTECRIVTECDRPRDRICGGSATPRAGGVTPGS